MHRFLAVVCALVLLTAACSGADGSRTTSAEPTSTSAPEVDFAGFAETLEGLREQLAIPGMSAAVVRNGELVWAEGFGYADLENLVRATAETPYHLASVTKPLAATLIMQLVEEGALDLDDPVSAYGVDLPDTVTVRHLLTHTSSGVPGTVHRYDGSRFGELGEVIEAVAGTTFRTAMFRRILEPAGMTQSAGNVLGCEEGVVHEIRASGQAVRAAMASPYQLDFGYQPVKSSYPTSYSPAAGLISSVVDLAKFDAALDANRLLSEEAKAEMLAPAVPTTGAGAEQMYGLGWYVQYYRGTRLEWHYGHWPPSISALYLRVPDHGLAFIVLGNTPNLSNPFPLGEGNVLLSPFAGAFYREFVFPNLQDAPLLDVDWTADQATLTNQLGAVADEEARGFLELELTSHRMMYHSVGLAEQVRRLEAVHAAVFGGGAGLNPFLASAALPAPKPEIAIDPALLKRVVGRYVVDEAASELPAGESTDGHVDITLQDGRLVVCASDMPPLTLVPVGEARFRTAPFGGEPTYLDVLLEEEFVLGFSVRLAAAYSVVYELATGAAPFAEWATAEPEAVGWSPDVLAEATALADELGSVAILAADGGDVFLDWGATDVKLPVHSIRKPLLGAVFGIHVATGEIDTDATLEELGIDDAPHSLTAAEKQATVRDLLMSRSGVYIPAAAEVPAMRDARPERGSHPPGTFYYYNNWDFNVLGTIFEQQTGMTVCEAFLAEVAVPIGMQDFTAEDCGYQYELQWSEHPAYPFTMTAHDLARFGLLYLHGGRWDSEQIVPTWWIDESWKPYSSLDDVAGISAGYLWLVASTDGEVVSEVGHEVYWHTGLGVHAVVIVPDLELVLVHRMDTTQTFTDPGEELFRLLGMVIAAGS